MDYEKLINQRAVGFSRDTGITTLEIREGYARGEIVLEEKHYNPRGSIHGGVLFTLADSIGGAAAASRGRYCTTVSGDIHFLRPAIDSKKLIAEAKEVKAGKNICVYEVMITDETGRELAVSTLTFYYLGEIDF